MMDLSKILITLGAILLIIGILLKLIGKLPGDILIKKGNFTFYFPIVTCIIISIILSLLFSFFGRGK
ncbi:DUF2905 domain-containing protein [Bacillus sp. RG28]|uniref:DUF2905 domain-containing protein n=1 Tax=Gottfriedia endophytica TaxID=2820819 RepID=A0A940SHE3_9BACI|nr:DUF2905 domain-containing protein [Gottfriedia endophytica]MBP0723860.1 DUF2905 domain-containing protein [Gottfriedia endophytica]